MSGAPIVYSVTVPLYNCAPVLPSLYRRLVAVLETLGERFEVIFVNDGSTDSSWAVLAGIAREDYRIVAIQLTRNVGQGLATLVGLSRSAGEILITLDDDLQHLPEEIPKLVAQLNDGADYELVLGVPVVRHHPLWRRLASWTTNAILTLALRKPWSLRFTGFRAMRREVAQRLLDMRWPDPALSPMLFQITRRIGFIPVEHSPSALPASRYSLRKLLRAVVGHFAAFSDAGRRRFSLAASGLGAALCAIALGGLASATEPSGPVSMASSLLGAAGMLALVLGLLVRSMERRLVDLPYRRHIAAPIQRIISDGGESRVG